MFTECGCRKANRVGTTFKLLVMKKLTKQELSTLKGGYECFMSSECTLPKGLGVMFLMDYLAKVVILDILAVVAVEILWRWIIHSSW